MELELASLQMENAAERRDWSVSVQIKGEEYAGYFLESWLAAALALLAGLSLDKTTSASSRNRELWVL